MAKRWRIVTPRLLAEGHHVMTDVHKKHPVSNMQDIRDQFTEAFPSAARPGVEIPVDLIMWAGFAHSEGYKNVERWATAEHFRGVQ
jgi:hypothetical protein